jgi:hypothetical protein
MPKQHFKYNTGSTITNTIQKGIHAIATEGTQDWGPTSVTGFYPETTPPSGGYTIYYMRPSGGPSVHVATNDTQAISFLKSFGSTGSTISDVLTWASNTANYYVQTGSTTGIITSGLVLHVDASNATSYPSTGTTWYDLSPNGYNGTLSGNATYNSGNGGYIDLQSNTGYVNFPSSVGSNTSAYSFGCWVNIPDKSVQPIFMGRGNDSLGGAYPLGWNMAVQMNSSSFVATIVTKVPYEQQIVTTYSSTPSINTWYYYTAVWNPGSSLKLYINGVLRATSNTSSTTLRTSNTGWNSTINSTNYNSKLGSMFVYNTVLSDADVLYNFNATKTRFGL